LRLPFYNVGPFAEGFISPSTSTLNLNDDDADVRTDADVRSDAGRRERPKWELKSKSVQGSILQNSISAGNFSD
jgi:hypothetical protein